jgi:7-cyano-7-deazaguanine synthase
MVDSVVIVSGGMDSVTLLHYLVKEAGRIPAVITFRYGQKHDKEIAFAESHTAELGCQEHLILNLMPIRAVFAGSALTSADVIMPTAEDVVGNPQPPTYVPNRNMIFLALSAAFAESQGVSDIYYGAQRHDMYGYWDTTPQFLAQLNNVYGLNRKTPIEIHAPFVELSKAQIVRKGLALGVDYGRTWSCYEGKEAACGRCPTCAERLAAFEELGLADPAPYLRRFI